MPASAHKVETDARKRPQPHKVETDARKVKNNAHKVESYRSYRILQGRILEFKDAITLSSNENNFETTERDIPWCNTTVKWELSIIHMFIEL